MAKSRRAALTHAPPEPGCDLGGVDVCSNQEQLAFAELELDTDLGDSLDTLDALDESELEEGSDDLDRDPAAAEPPPDALQQLAGDPGFEELGEVEPDLLDLDGGFEDLEQIEPEALSQEGTEELGNTPMEPPPPSPTAAPGMGDEPSLFEALPEVRAPVEQAHAEGKLGAGLVSPQEAETGGAAEPSGGPARTLTPPAAVTPSNAPARGAPRPQEPTLDIKMRRGRGYTWLAKRINKKMKGIPGFKPISSKMLKSRMMGQMLYGKTSYAFSHSDLMGKGALSGGRTPKQIKKAQKASRWWKRTGRKKWLAKKKAERDLKASFANMKALTDKALAGMERAEQEKEVGRILGDAPEKGGEQLVHEAFGDPALQEGSGAPGELSDGMKRRLKSLTSIKGMTDITSDPLFAQKAISGNISTDLTETALETLRGMRPDQVRSLDAHFQKTHGKSLVAYLGQKGTIKNMDAIRGYVEGSRADGALAELRQLSGKKLLFGADDVVAQSTGLKRVLGSLGAKDLADLKTKAAQDPEAAKLLSLHSTLFEQADRSAKATSTDLDPETVEAHGIDPSKPATLEGKSLAQIKAFATSALKDGKLDREQLLGVFKRSGLDPAAFEAVKHVTDPERVKKATKRDAELLVGFLETDLKGDMADHVNGFVLKKLERLQGRIKKASASGSLDPETFKALEAEYHALLPAKAKSFHSSMKRLETVADVATATADVAKFVARKTMYAGTLVLTGGNVAAAEGAEALTAAGLEFVGTAANAHLLEGRSIADSVELGAVKGLGTGAYHMATPLGLEGFGGGLAKASFDTLTNTTLDVMRSNMDDDRKLRRGPAPKSLAELKARPGESGTMPKHLAKSSRDLARMSDEEKTAYIRQGGPKRRSLGQVLAKNAVKSVGSELLWGAEGKLGGPGKSLKRHLGTAVLGHNARGAWGSAVDEGEQRLHEGKSLNVGDVALGALGKQAKAIVSNPFTNLAAPMAKVGVARSGDTTNKTILKHQKTARAMGREPPTRPQIR